MSNDEMKQLAEVVRTIVKEENKPIIEKLDTTVKELAKTNEKLDSTFDQVGDLTVKVDVEIIPKLDNHTKILKEHTKILKKLEDQSHKNSEDIKKFDKRLLVVEANDGIQTPIEHQIV